MLGHTCAGEIHGSGIDMTQQTGYIFDEKTEREVEFTLDSEWNNSIIPLHMFTA